MTSEPKELELTPDLLEYAKAVALGLAPKHCKPRLARPTAAKSDLDERPWADLVQEVTLQLLRRPPKYDPARGASPKTLIYTIVQRAVMKCGARHPDRLLRGPPAVGRQAAAHGGGRRPGPAGPRPTTGQGPPALEVAMRTATLEIYRDSRREYRWRLKASNGRILADSGEGYRRKASAVHGARRVRELIAVGKIKEVVTCSAE